MFKKMIVPALAAALTLLVTSSQALAFAAYHAGYTHVGPNGAYHMGETTAVGGGSNTGQVYHGSYNYGAAANTGQVYHGSTNYGGQAAGGYHYSASYGNTSYGGAVRTGGGYVR